MIHFKHSKISQFHYFEPKNIWYSEHRKVIECSKLNTNQNGKVLQDVDGLGKVQHDSRVMSWQIFLYTNSIMHIMAWEFDTQNVIMHILAWKFDTQSTV